MQILPSPELRAFIKHYLFISSVAPLANVLRIFGDGNTGIVFCLGSTLLSTDQDKLPKTFVYGQITDHKTLSANGTILLCIVVFHPFGMNGFPEVHVPLPLIYSGRFSGCIRGRGT